MYTFPAQRRRGYGSRVLAVANAALDSGDRDLALLFCLPALAPFYQRAGWAELRRPIVSGPAGAAEPLAEELALRRGRTERGRLLIEQDGPPLHVGRYTW